MPKVYKLELDSSQKAELIKARDTHPKPYVRERAAAILKVGAGQSIRQVALHGLLKPRDPDRVREWIERYRTEGSDGLLVREGRGRKPSFSPSE